MESFKAGYVAILGLPNSGKSTLINALLEQKLNIISDKPQTTRRKIRGILTKENYQIIFVDTPGLIHPNYLLQERMMEAVEVSAKDADVILLLQDVKEDFNGEKLLHQDFVNEVLMNLKAPKILLLNKVDLSNQDDISTLIEKQQSTNLFTKVIPISAKRNFNLTDIINSVVELIPEHPKYYPDDELTDESERFFVAEIIREKILEHYSEEVPYSSEVLIADFKEREIGKDFIEAYVIVEKESQKAIIIGKEGKAIKKLGEASRKSIEEFLQREIFLELRVKVKPKWRKDENMLNIFGYGKEK
ncbi:MAG TPA: GTPase Era [Ignavibacteriales bacterium]|nr:GTPase Era [Ignavibacteriales bacterium]